MKHIQSILLLALLGMLIIPQQSKAVGEDHKTLLQGTIQESVEAVPEVGIIGFDLEIRPRKFPVVQSVFPGTPASNAGILPGDEIVTINHQPTQGLSSFTVDERLSNIPGDWVLLQIDRQGSFKTVKLQVAPLGKLPKPVQALYR